MANGPESSLLIRLTNSLNRQKGVHVTKTHGGMYAKDIPDLDIVDTRADVCRKIELKAFRKEDVGWGVKFQRALPASLTGGQRARLEDVTGDGLSGNRHVGGLLVVEYQGPRNHLHIVVPNRRAWLHNSVFLPRDYLVPSLFPLHGEACVCYAPTRMKGDEFDSLLWLFTKPWWLQDAGLVGTHCIVDREELT